VRLYLNAIIDPAHGDEGSAICDGDESCAISTTHAQAQSRETL